MSAIGPSLTVMKHLLNPTGEQAGGLDQYSRYRMFVERAVEAFGDPLTASRWLSVPNADFDDQPPIKYAAEVNYDLSHFEDRFIQIEHGIYS